jgi:hypothetical protein
MKIINTITTVLFIIMIMLNYMDRQLLIEELQLGLDLLIIIFLRGVHQLNVSI